MNLQHEPVPRRTVGRFLTWALVVLLVLAVGLSNLIAANPVKAANPMEGTKIWIDQFLEKLFQRGQTEVPVPKFQPGPAPTGVLRLTLDDAMTMFLKQNLDLIIANFGIDAAKGRQITARLFPNPTLSVNTFSAYTQGCNIPKCGAVAPTLSQLFEVAGKRGYRRDVAALDTMSIEAQFEDTVRQLGFTLKETYFRVQRQRGHLTVDQEIQSVLVKLLKGHVEEGVRRGPDLDQVRLGLLAVNADSEVLRDLQNIEEVSGDLRMMLGILPDVELELTTDLIYRKIEPNFASLVDYALENRPDIRGKRLTRDKRKKELQLAKAVRYPNVTTELGYMVQGPRGPDNQQQWALNLSVPLPVFNRNQGGIVEAEVGIKAIEAEIAKTKIQIQNEVAVAYRKFLHGRKIVDAMNGALDQASTLFRAAEQGYKTGEVGILDLENTRRSYGDTKESYLEAIFGYEDNWLRLEWAVGRDIAF